MHCIHNPLYIYVALDIYVLDFFPLVINRRLNFYLESCARFMLSFFIFQQQSTKITAAAATKNGMQSDCHTFHCIQKNKCRWYSLFELLAFFLLWVWIFGRGKKHQEEKWRQYFLELTSATSLPLDVWHNLITVNFHVNVTTFSYGWNDFCKRKKGASSDFRRHKLNHTNQISPFDHSIYWYFFFTHE